MSSVTLPRADIPIDDAGNRASRDLYRWMRDITERVGGTLGAGTDDLSASAFEDAGIEETKAALFMVAGNAGQLPPTAEMMAEIQHLTAEVEELRALVHEVYKALAGAQMGGVLQ
jgi:hypothetical protein